MRSSSLAATYARGVSSVVTSRERQAVLEELRWLCELIRSNDRYVAFLCHPGIRSQDKKELIHAAGSGHLSEVTLRLCDLLVDNGRLAYLDAIALQLSALIDREALKVRVTMKTAFPVGPRVAAEVERALAAFLKRTIDLHIEIDPAVLGGARLFVDDLLIDGSLAGELHKLRRHVAAEAIDLTKEES